MARPSGHILIDGREVADTLQCAHCGCHWQVVRGSGRRRGWCMCCAAPTCGSRECDQCVPYEQQIEQIESGKRQ